jgi:hypothetical protein
MRPWTATPDGRLDDLLGEALTVDRVLYLAVPVAVPAGGTAEVTASLWKRPSYDFGGSGTGREDLQGFEVLTTVGSSLTFTGQTAAVVNTDGVEIPAEDFGLDSGGTALLDLSQSRYGLEIRPLDN